MQLYLYILHHGIPTPADLLKFTPGVSWSNTKHFNMISYDTVVVNTFIVPLFLPDSNIDIERLKLS